MKLVEIQQSLKSKYNLNIVCIQSGKFFVFLNEDAKLISDHFSFKTHRKGDFEFTGFPVWFDLNRFIDFFKKEKLNYAVLYQLKEVLNDNQEKVRRIVTNTSNPEILGLEFSNVRFYENYKFVDNSTSNESDFLEAILKGYDPITGEVLSNSSVWKHPHILRDIKEFLESNNHYSRKPPHQKVNSKEINLSDSDLFLLKHLLMRVSAIVPNLAPREIEIIQTLYNIDNNNKTTLDEVGRKYDLSRERIRQIKEKIIKKITRSKYGLYKPQLTDEEKAPYESEIKPKRLQNSYILDPSIDINYFVVPDLGKISNEEFFELEKLKSFTPINYQLSSIWMESWKIKDYLDDFRNDNVLNGKLINHGMPITKEEIGLVIKLKEQGYSLEVLERYFQRSKKTLENILISNEKI